jgi:hydrogenase maturation protein HypF
MPTYHMRFRGIVQGVGFRPFVYQKAHEQELKGWVKNSGSGLEIRVTATLEKARAFYRFVKKNAPPLSLITKHSIRTVKDESFDDFTIVESAKGKQAGTLPAPDIALCDSCRNELNNTADRRYRYAFTTCLNCGPRYSIITGLPYDRPNTTMASLHMCRDCIAEYEKPGGYRQHSQTNSCPECAIPMYLYTGNGEELNRNANEILENCVQVLKAGKILAVKGIGGYLLLTDATNPKSIETLRIRKQRPAKPFAVMYPNLSTAKGDAILFSYHEEALKAPDAPVVICEQKEKPESGLCGEQIAPGLGTVGILLPYSPLYELLMQQINRPLIATSANLSGAPIIYGDKQALEHLGNFADYILAFGRDIVAPQDDSVVHYTSTGKRILLRRSRGLAPNYQPYPFKKIKKQILAMGADMKGAFAWADREKVLISQFLGNQESYDSQLSFRETLRHLRELYSFKPVILLADSHPGYHSTQMAEELAKGDGTELIYVQHHKAHFMSVLAENGLLHTDDDVLGFIWDGTGYGEDNQIWGGEIFIRQHHRISRLNHIAYFPVLAGDKMSKEPRLSAMSLIRNLPEAEHLLKGHFSDREWDFYKKLAAYPERVSTSSMGRFLDGIGCLLGAGTHNTYEAQTAMKLEYMARKTSGNNLPRYEFHITNDTIGWQPFLAGIIRDIKKKRDKKEIAAGVFHSLAAMICQISYETGISRLAFSGGVFQNAVLVDEIIKQNPGNIELYFHKQLSPNDENISFGQIAWYEAESG